MTIPPLSPSPLFSGRLVDALSASLSEVAPQTCSGLLAFVLVSIGGGRIGRAGMDAVDDCEEVEEVRWGVEQDDDDDDEWIGVSDRAEGGEGLSAGRRWEACGEVARPSGIPGGALFGRGGDSVEVMVGGRLGWGDATGPAKVSMTAHRNGPAWAEAAAAATTQNDDRLSFVGMTIKSQQ